MISGWQKSSYLIPKSLYHSFSWFVACDEFCAIINKIKHPIGIAISSNLFGSSISLIDAGMAR